MRVGETPVDAVGKEYALLAHLATDPRARVHQARAAARRVGLPLRPASTRTLDSHACRLRRKLASTGDARFVENVWGVGYRLAGLDLPTSAERAA